MPCSAQYSASASSAARMSWAPTKNALSITAEQYFKKLLLAECPLQGIGEEFFELRSVKQRLVMSELEIDIAGFLLLVYPDDRMVAHRRNGAIGTRSPLRSGILVDITCLVDMGKHQEVVSRI